MKLPGGSGDNILHYNYLRIFRRASRAKIDPPNFRERFFEFSFLIFKNVMQKIENEIEYQNLKK